jgi:hypothetical protein
MAMVGEPIEVVEVELSPADAPAEYTPSEAPANAPEVEAVPA